MYVPQIINAVQKLSTKHNLWQIYSKSFNIRSSYATSAARSVSPVCVKAREFEKNVAIVEEDASYTYADLLNYSRALAKKIIDVCGVKQSVKEQNRIAFLCPNDVSYVFAQWATWQSGNVTVPLHKSHPTSQLEYYITDSQARLIMATPDLAHKLEPIREKLKIPLLVLDSRAYNAVNDANSDHCVPDSFYDSTDALIMYTSGTTGPPKGVVLTHANVQAQLETIVEAFGLTAKDSVLHLLPLHHTHGIIHALLSPMDVGARVVMMKQFDSAQVWKELLSEKEVPDRVNVVTAVPTMYVMLIEEYVKMHGQDEFIPTIREICRKKMRLMACGSAALPEPIFSRWKQMTGHRILERFGMTETGLSLANPLHGERKPSFVGLPINSVEVCIGAENKSSTNGYDTVAVASAKGVTVTPGKESEAGELLVKGPSVFKGYWKKPEATEKSFTPDGWFKTGDTVSFREGSFKVEGRTSVDIIKSGGYKISALDVERHLLSHPNVAEVVVVGVSDPVWGQRVAAVVVKKIEQDLALPQLKEWCKERMPPYTIPTVLKVLQSLPKNAVGKVNKKELVKQIFEEQS